MAIIPLASQGVCRADLDAVAARSGKQEIIEATIFDNVPMATLRASRETAPCTQAAETITARRRRHVYRHAAAGAGATTATATAGATTATTGATPATPATTIGSSAAATTGHAASSAGDPDPGPDATRSDVQSHAVSHPGAFPAVDALRRAVSASFASIRDHVVPPVSDDGTTIRRYSAYVYDALVRRDIPARNRHLAERLADLVRQASVDGYDALHAHFVRDMLIARLPRLPVEVLGDLARLDRRQDESRVAILWQTETYMAGARGVNASNGRLVGIRSEAAAALLSLVGQLAVIHATPKIWSEPVTALMEAARLYKPQRIAAALRSMWDGELLMGDPKTSVTERLVRGVGQLGRQQRFALARMLGLLDGGGDAATLNFARFEKSDLPRLIADPVILAQIRKYIGQLKAALRIVISAGSGRRAAARLRSETGEDAKGLSVPPSCDSESSITKFMSKLSSRYNRLLFWRRPTLAHTANAQIEFILTQLSLRELDQGEAQRVRLLQLMQTVGMKLSRPNLAPLYLELLQRQLCKLDWEQLHAIRDNPVLIQDTDMERNADGGKLILSARLRQAIDREPAYRYAAIALAQILSALRKDQDTSALRHALDMLADAQYHMPAGQSELDCYENALRRLDPAVCKDLHALLNGEAGWRRRAAALLSTMATEPASSRHYRSRQLEALALAVRNCVDDASKEWPLPRVLGRNDDPYVSESSQGR